MRSLPNFCILLLAAGLLIAPASMAASKSKKKKAKTEEVNKYKVDKYTKMFVNDKSCLSAKGPFLTLHKLKGKLYVEVPLKTIGREMLIASTISEASDTNLGTIGYKPTNPIHVKFTRIDTTLYLSQAVVPPVHDPNDPHLSKAIGRSTLPPIIHAYPLVCYNRDSSAMVIEMTKFFSGDNELIAPIKSSKGGMVNITGKFKSEGSVIDQIKSFEDNVTVKSYLSYSVTADLLGLVVLKKDEPMTVKVTRTILLLPEEAMQPRLADSRIGIFQTNMTRINGKKDKIEDFSVINRWDIRPKDFEAWKRGELVEPVKPIVFYLDNAFPQLWREPIRRGVLRWNKAFEKIGFKNVMHIKDFPKDDPEFDPDNLKYSCIRYVPAAVANAMGPSWVDPRSGEIINASVLMYNDVVKLAATWRFVQTAQIDERVRSKELPDDVFQESLEYILAHEVGHCLGLMHNMAASNAFPVDSLRSASFTQQYGTTPSIMDYARFNYVAQPGDKGVKLTPPDLGPYDAYVIKYAYTPLPDKKDMFDEEKTLRGWIDEKVGDLIYRYGRQQLIARYDPSAIEEDLGDDHIKAGDYGICNLKYILAHMEEWIPDEEDPDLKIRTEFYAAAAEQFARYVNAVMLNIGGIYLTDVNSNTAGGAQAVPVPKELQRASLKWVLAQMKDSAWLEQSALTEKLPLHVDLSSILRFNFCRSFFSYYKNVMLSSHIADDPYTPQKYMNDLYDIVFENTIKGRPASPSERLIQRMFVDAAAGIASNEAKRMKLGGIAEAYAPSVDEIALMGLDPSGTVECYLGLLRQVEEEHGKGYIASLLWNSEALSSGYGWQHNVQLRSIDESRALFVNVSDRILKLLRSRVNNATGETRAHYQGMIYVLERSLFPSQKN
ncbi:zinc-dependent metalloprotease [Alistipes sp.]|uniref:zinc-dependent metalloprotease n=1 Tax=Alistipes sp. TaxID=1872444 RepID=UPI0025BB58CB|nr:zinc-dependent metalloprotease [Alistipes sp.]